MSSVENNAYPRSRRPSLTDVPPRRSTSDSALFQASQRSKRASVPSATQIPVPGESSSSRLVRVMQSVAARVQEEAESQVEAQAIEPSGLSPGELGDIKKSTQVLQATVSAMETDMKGQAQPEAKRLAMAAQQVVMQAAANVIADRNVSIGRAPVVPNKSTVVQRVSVNELSDATHDAIVQAVKSNHPASTGVDIIVAAASILKAQAPVGPEPHPPSAAITRPNSLPITLTSAFSTNLPSLPEYA